MCSETLAQKERGHWPDNVSISWPVACNTWSCLRVLAVWSAHKMIAPQICFLFQQLTTPLAMLLEWIRKTLHRLSSAWTYSCRVTWECDVWFCLQIPNLDCKVLSWRGKYTAGQWVELQSTAGKVWCYVTIACDRKKAKYRGYVVVIL